MYVKRYREDTMITTEASPVRVYLQTKITEIEADLEYADTAADADFRRKLARLEALQATSDRHIATCLDWYPVPEETETALDRLR